MGTFVGIDHTTIKNNKDIRFDHLIFSIKAIFAENTALCGKPADQFEY
jgi:hypothetical protein